MAQPAVRQSIREIDTNNWIIGNQISLVRTLTETPGCWSDGYGAFLTASAAAVDSVSEESASFIACEAGSIGPNVSQSRPIKKIYDAGDEHATWKIGDAYLKVIKLVALDITREHTTLEFLRQKKLDFQIPDVLFHGEWDGRYYLILSSVPGQTLDSAWPNMDEIAKSKLVRRVASICKNLSAMESTYIGGVDKQYLPERWLTRRSSQGDFRSSALLQSCLEIGMDCSTFRFYHCDLGPTNILVGPKDNNLVGIIDWECAGFVPREWIRTKFRVCSGLDLTTVEPHDSSEWRGMVGRQLGEDGFQDCVLGYMKWRLAVCPAKPS